MPTLWLATSITFQFMTQPPTLPAATLPPARPAVRVVEAMVVEEASPIIAEVADQAGPASEPFVERGTKVTRASRVYLPARVWFGLFWAWECFFGAITLLLV